jgi:hypothetical protein
MSRQPLSMWVSWPREIVGGQRGVGGAQQPLAVQVLLPLDRGVVDAQQPRLCATQVAAQPGLARSEPTSSSRRRTEDAPLPAAAGLLAEFDVSITRP